MYLSGGHLPSSDKALNSSPGPGRKRGEGEFSLCEVSYFNISVVLKLLDVLRFESLLDS